VSQKIKDAGIGEVKRAVNGVQVRRRIGPPSPTGIAIPPQSNLKTKA
jgi:hypothetical protein